MSILDAARNSREVPFRLNRLFRTSLLLSGLTAFCLLAVAPSHAKGLGKVVETKGEWQLRVGKDDFSDKTSCVITHVKDTGIQVSDGAFYLSYHGRGGVDGFQYRIDDFPPSPMQLPTRIEKDLSLVKIGGKDHQAILGSNRLRVQVITLVSGVDNVDLKLKGLGDLYKKMQKTCQEY